MLRMDELLGGKPGFVRLFAVQDKKVLTEDSRGLAIILNELICCSKMV